MAEKKEFMKVLAKIETTIVLTGDGLYERQQWPVVVEWWQLGGDGYNTAEKVAQSTADYLEMAFKEQR